jgi:hypothetical protein
MAKTTPKATKKGASAKDGRVRIMFGVLGESLRPIGVKEGYSLGQLTKKYGLAGLTIKVNGSTQRDEKYVFTNNDEVVAVPQAKNG